MQVLKFVYDFVLKTMYDTGKFLYSFGLKYNYLMTLLRESNVVDRIGSFTYNKEKVLGDMLCLIGGTIVIFYVIYILQISIYWRDLLLQVLFVTYESRFNFHKYCIAIMLKFFMDYCYYYLNIKIASVIDIIVKKK